MKTIIYLIQKEFIQIFRNRMMLPFIFVVPIVQLLILVNAATLDMKSIDFCVVDHDNTEFSRNLSAKFSASPFFNFHGYFTSFEQAAELLEKEGVDMILQIPDDFESSLHREQNASLQLVFNAINATAASISYAYCQEIIIDYNANIMADMVSLSDMRNMQSIEIRSRFWYNQDLNFKIYMVPGILVILVTLIGLILASLNIVREKEMGTIEQINVTPIKKYQFIAGKLLPFWIIALVELAFGLFLGKLIFDIPLYGSLWVLFAFTAIYLMTTLGIGLFMSTMAQTQQQVMFLNFFFLITFTLMSGVFTPAESMPEWAQIFNTINPIAYFMRVIRMILIKGSGFAEISREFYTMLIYGTVMISLATWRYRKKA